MLQTGWRYQWYQSALRFPRYQDANITVRPSSSSHSRLPQRAATRAASGCEHIFQAHPVLIRSKLLSNKLLVITLFVCYNWLQSFVAESEKSESIILFSSPRRSSGQPSSQPTSSTRRQAPRRPAWGTVLFSELMTDFFATQMQMMRNTVRHFKDKEAGIQNT